MERGFRYLEHTADVYVEAWGPGLSEAFEEAAKAMYNVMTDLSRVEARDEFLVEASGFDKESLLYDWLERLLEIHDVHGYFLCRFRVLEIGKGPDGLRLCGVAWGEQADPVRHEFLTYVKSPTYSLMEIVEGDGRVTLRFVLDI